MTPEIIADYQNETGEGCLWHPEEQRLYWLDIPAGLLFCYDPATGHSARFELGAPTGAFTIAADGDLVLFMAAGAVRTWRAGHFTGTIIESLPEELDNRFNDVIADPEGRVFCGVMSTPRRAGRLYRLDPDGQLTIVLPDTGTSNGMGFSPDEQWLYHCDSRRGTITRFRYDRATGALSEPGLFLDAPVPGGGGPDGMTVDAEGCIWSARWNDGCLVRYDPSAREIGRIAFPARKVSCVTFGGPDYTDCYVTTAGGGARAEEGSGAGALFHLRPGVRGKPEFRSRLRALV
ncbi:MAG: SMP-30/gluconolactonase/LRE family protein [Candidatus Marinimicrobia bacterium]|nr:SMP-30/gluconolactonase/LRE family protein [Candidatus Neomarinimicrobiota bacterium]